MPWRTIGQVPEKALPVRKFHFTGSSKDLCHEINCYLVAAGLQ